VAQSFGKRHSFSPAHYASRSGGDSRSGEDSRSGGDESHLVGECPATRCARRTNAARAAASSIAKKAFSRSRPSRVIASGIASSAGASRATVAPPRVELLPAGCNCTTLHTLPLSRGPSPPISRQDITLYLCRKLQKADRSISARASYAAVRLSSVVCGSGPTQLTKDGLPVLGKRERPSIGCFVPKTHGITWQA
jgi:hypothetical protein